MAIANGSNVFDLRPKSPRIPLLEPVSPDEFNDVHSEDWTRVDEWLLNSYKFHLENRAESLDLIMESCSFLGGFVFLGLNEADDSPPLVLVSQALAFLGFISSFLCSMLCSRDIITQKRRCHEIAQMRKFQMQIRTHEGSQKEPYDIIRDFQQYIVFNHIKWDNFSHFLNPVRLTNRLNTMKLQKRKSVVLFLLGLICLCASISFNTVFENHVVDYARWSVVAILGAVTGLCLAALWSPAKKLADVSKRAGWIKLVYCI